MADLRTRPMVVNDDAVKGVLTTSETRRSHRPQGVADHSIGWGVQGTVEAHVTMTEPLASTTATDAAVAPRAGNTAP